MVPGNSDHLLRLCQNILKGFNNQNKTAAIFFDLKKAIDRTWNKGFLLKLNELNTPGHFQNWVNGFLENRKFKVASCTITSQIREMVDGVPQGSSISPILFFFIYRI